MLSNVVRVRPSNYFLKSHLLISCTLPWPGMYWVLLTLRKPCRLSHSTQALARTAIARAERDCTPTALKGRDLYFAISYTEKM